MRLEEVDEHDQWVVEGGERLAWMGGACIELVVSDDERFPDYFHVIVDPLGKIFASASENRPVPEFKFRYKSRHERDHWDCIVAFPLSQLPKTKRIAAFRRLVRNEAAGIWPSNGPGFKNAVLHELDTYAPFTLGE